MKTTNIRPIRNSLFVSAATLFILSAVLLTSLPSEASESRIIRVGAYDNMPKIGIQPNGKVTGFWAELMGHIAAKEGWEIEYIKGNWDEGLTNLSEGKIDVMPDVAFTKSRAKLYYFSNTSVMASWSRVYVRANDNRIKSLEDLSGMLIAGLSGSVNIDGPDGIKNMVQSFNLNCRVVETTSYEEVFNALLDGYADAVIANRNFGDEYIKRNPAKKTPIMLSPVSLTFAFPMDAPNSKYLQTRIDYQMTKLMDDNNSIYYKLLNKYFEPNIAEKKIHIFPMWVKILLGIAALSLLFIIIVLMATKKQVAAKTKELQTLNSNLNDKIISETEKRIKHEKSLFDQQKHADMGHMIKSIAHQWRQPLNNIYIISQNMQDEWKNGKKYDQAVENEFDKQEEIIQHMSDTIDDFLYFFKPDKQKLRFNVTQSVLRCMRLINAESQNKRIHISCICDCDGDLCEIKPYDQNPCKCSDIYTEGYEGEFKQIILNLMSNSIYALSKTDNSYKRITVKIHESNGILTLKVSDNGGGVPDEVLSKIFDPYFTTKEEGEGIGIGLHMSRTIIVNHMNGDIQVRNTDEGFETIITLKSS